MFNCSSIFYGFLALYFVITNQHSFLGVIYMGIMVLVHIIADSKIQQLKEAAQ